MYNDIWEEFYCTRCEKKHNSNVGNPLYQKDNGDELCETCNKEYLLNSQELQDDEEYYEDILPKFTESSSFVWLRYFLYIILTMSILLYL